MGQQLHASSVAVAHVSAKCLKSVADFKLSLSEHHPPPPSPSPNNGLPPVTGLSLGLYAAFLCAIVRGAAANGSRQP